MPTHGTPAHPALEDLPHLRALQTNIDLLSSLVEAMTPLAGIPLPALTPPQQTRCRILVHAANETLRGMETSTEIEPTRVAEVRWLMRRVEEWRYRMVVVLVKLEMAVALSAAMAGGRGGVLL